MRELEELLRQSSHQSLPESAPGGSFEALRARMEGPKRRRSGLLLILAGLLMLGGWRALQPAEAEARSERAVQPSGPREIDARAPTPEAVAPPVQRREAEIPAPISAAARPDRPATYRSEKTPALIQDSATRSLPIPQPAPPSVIAPLLQTNGVAPYLTSVRFDSVSSGNSASLLPLPQEGLRTRTGYWDVSLSAYPTPLSSGGYLTELSAEPDPNFPPLGTNFLVDGRSKILYGSNYHSIENRTFHPIVQLRINRQTGGVLRYGMGATVYTGISNQFRPAAALAEGNPAGYFTAYRERMNIGLASAHVGITLRRERRLQPWIDLGLQVGITGRRRTDRYIVTHDNPEGWLQSTEIEGYDYLGGEGPALVPSLEAGLQYRLGGGWSAGVNVGAAPGSFASLLPTPGIEIRYRR